MVIWLYSSSGSIKRIAKIILNCFQYCGVNFGIVILRNCEYYGIKQMNNFVTVMRTTIFTMGLKSYRYKFEFIAYKPDGPECELDASVWSYDAFHT